jgi:hypothetical protein
MALACRGQAPLDQRASQILVHGVQRDACLSVW